MTEKPKAPKRKKISNPPPPTPPFRLPASSALSPLPNEVVVSLLAQISKSYYSSLCLVSKSFYALLSSPEIYAARSEIGATEPRLYLYLKLPRPERNHLFIIGAKSGLAQVSLSSSYAPARLNSTSVSVGYEIYQIGGSNLSGAVRVLDCRNHTWRRSPRLTMGRKNAKSCFLDGKIYVIGGRENESMISGEVFDIKTQIWKPLPSPIHNDKHIIDSNLQVVVLEGRLNVITKKSKYVYDTEQERWVRDIVWFGGIRKVRNRPCCVIDDVMFVEIDGEYKWYNSENGKWLVVENLDIVYVNRTSSPFRYQTVQLVNHGGNLVILWQRYCYNFKYIIGRIDKSEIWCAVIRLEKRLTYLGIQIWGEVECCRYLLTVPKSFNLLSCLSISL